ncbi:MAG: hypothetical protein AMJ70_03325 [Dehalococcoidia bacterium SG8_51_3]|nr:MAG: hypothetical protein AMJ70_03325 [Dehalococcoidia bacterium SG8_51_3]
MPGALLGGVSFEVGAVHTAHYLLGAVNAVELEIGTVTFRSKDFLRCTPLYPGLRCLRPVLVEPVIYRNVPRPLTEAKVAKPLPIRHRNTCIFHQCNSFEFSIAGQAVIVLLSSIVSLVYIAQTLDLSERVYFLWLRPID